MTDGSLDVGLGADLADLGSHLALPSLFAVDADRRPSSTAPERSSHGARAGPFDVHGLWWLPQSCSPSWRSRS